MTYEAGMKLRVQVSGTLLFKNADGEVKEVPFEGKSAPMDPEDAQKVVESISVELKRD